jgi:hypothetical protein
MAVNVDKVTAGGLEHILYGVIDGTGYCQGSGASALSAGTQALSGLAELKKVKNFPFTPTEPGRTFVTGGGGVVSQYLYKPIELPSTEAEFAVNDHNFAALAMTQVVQDLGGFSLLGIQPGEVTYRDIMFLTCSQAKSQDTGSINTSGFYGHIILKTNCYYRGPSNNAERENKSFLYSIAANSSDRYPWGTAFTAVLNGDTEYAAFEWSFPYKPMLDSGVGDNSRVEYTLTHTPAADDANTILAFVDGVAKTWVTGAPGAGEFGVTTTALTFGTAPGTNAKINILYGVSSY